MAQMNRKQLRGKAPMKKSTAPTKKPPATVPGRGGDASLENPRAYLGALASDDSMKMGYRVVTKELDMHDRDRNPIGGIDPDCEMGKEE